jgi:endonuclease/exonuclease/phosphatase (EEP) superfamily protein YafD
VANLHASQSRRDRPAADLARAVAHVEAWAPSGPLILGGDLNQRGRPVPPGYAHVAGHSVDHILLRGLEPEGPAEVLERGSLSDHAPLAVSVREAGSS